MDGGEDKKFLRNKFMAGEGEDDLNRTTNLFERFLFIITFETYANNTITAFDGGP